jgi:hypothetical protein
MKKTSLLLLLCLTVALSVGCNNNEEDSAVVVKQTKSSEEIEIPSLGNFQYHMIINASGDNVLQDSDGNEIYPSDDGKYYDADGNLIEDYDDLTNTDSDTAVTSADSEEVVEVETVTLENGMTPEEYLHDLDKESKKDAFKNPLEDSVDFENANEAIDYNPYVGDNKATSGTEIEQTLFTEYGTALDGGLTINSVNIDGGSGSCDITINYDYSELLNSVVGAYETEEEAKQAIASENINCYISGKTSSGIDIQSDTQELSINEDGSINVSFNISGDENINEIYLYVGSSIIALQ